MAIEVNNGATGNQLVNAAAPVDATNLALTLDGWFYFDSLATTNQYLLNIRTAAFVYGYTFRMNPIVAESGTLGIIRVVGSTDVVAAASGAVTTTAGWVYICIQCTGSHASGNYLDVWVKNSGDSVPLQKTITYLGTSASANNSLSGNPWDLFNRASDTARPMKGRAMDCGIWTGTQGAFCLSSTEIANRAAGTAANGFTPASGATLRKMPRFIGGSMWDEADSTSWTNTNGSTIRDGTHMPLADVHTDGYPAIASLSSYWSADQGVVYNASSKTNNVHALLDIAGGSRALYHDNSAYRMRWKDGADQYGKVLACSLNGAQTNQSTFKANNPASTLKNYDITVSGIFWANADGARELFKTSGLTIKTDTDGAFVVTAGGSDYTLSPSRYLYAKPMPWVVTISNEAGTSARTITLYTIDGSSTATTSPYAAATTNTLTSIGCATGNDGTAQHCIGWKRCAYHSAVASSSQAATILAALRTIAAAPAAYKGGVVYYGSSTVEGNSPSREACRNALYQTTRLGRARCFNYGDFGIGTSDLTITLSNSTLLGNPGDPVVQDVTGATATITYQNGTRVYLRESTTGWTTARNVNGTLGIENVSATNGIGAGYSLTSIWTATKVTRLLKFIDVCLADGPCVLVLFASSNSIEAFNNAADEIEILKKFVTYIKGLRPRLKVVINENLPRSGGHGSTHRTFNASLRSTTGYWDAVVKTADDTGFDFKDSGGTVDDGVYDISAGRPYYDTDNDTPYHDSIHTSEAGHGAIATKMDLVLPALLADNLGDRIGRINRLARVGR